MARRVVIVGGGIVGVAVAAALAETADVSVTVLERGPRGTLPGSTGHAPGFVGLLGEAPVATELARVSASAYAELQHGRLRGFDRVGGLEVATTDEGMADLRRRAELAAEMGLPAVVLDAAQTVARAPELIESDRCVGGVLYSEDGIARAAVITAALAERGARNGVDFLHAADVSAIDTRDARVRAVRCRDGRVYAADDVVLACGIWGPSVAALAGQDLPLTPVAHPYLMGPPRVAPSRSRDLGDPPFVRWPEHHVYARDHGDRLGFGTYDHAPHEVAAEMLGTSAEQPWLDELFGPAVRRALTLLPADQRFDIDRRLNGVFSMTADNLPLLGPSETTRGLWIAEAIWVTHAAGAARALVEMMTGQTPSFAGLDALNPDRFAGRSRSDLAENALRLYRDIYPTA